MEEKEILKKQIEDLESQIKPLKDRLSKIYKSEVDDVGFKLKRCYAGKDSFELNDLVFSSHAICMCGAGLAYPKNTGIRGCWDCSDILLGTAIPNNQKGGQTHDGSMPFAFYDIKSEGQPSAYGATTRPTRLTRRVYFEKIYKLK